jgi:hypothetical protein
MMLTHVRDGVIFARRCRLCLPLDVCFSESDLTTAAATKRRDGANGRRCTVDAPLTKTSSICSASKVPS